MIPAGLVNALHAWAYDDEDRIASLVTERDALIGAFLNGGKASTTLTAASANGKTSAMMVGLSREDKLTVLTSALVQLGEIDESILQSGVSFADFSQLRR